jgi:eukaryotic-like serine/threonine-protein kinase
VQAIASHEVQRASKVVPKIPAAFDALVAQMMARDPEARPTGSDVVRRLESIRKPGGTGLHSNMRIWAAVAIVVLAVVGLWIWMRKPLTNPARRTADVRQVRIIPFTSYEGSEIEPAFSPDGKQIAFTWTGEDGLNSDIYTKAIGSEKLLRLTSDPAEEFAPAWSPDGRQIAFLRRKRGTSAPLVMVVPAGGGKALPAGEISDPEGFPGPIGWWPDSHSLVVRDSTPAGIALVRLFPGTGEKRVLTNPPNLESDGLPVLSPDGRRMAFTRRQIRGASVCLLDVETSQSRCIHHVDSPGETTHGVVGGLAWQGDGALLYSAREAIWRLNLAGADQSAAKFLEGTFPFLTGDPQGRRLAFSKTYSDVNIWRSSSIGKPIDKLAPSSEEESEPQYSSDGSKILFRSRRTGAFEIFTCAADGSGLKQLTSFGGHLGSASWSPDAKWIAFDGYASPTDRNAKYTNIYLVSSSSGAIRRVSADVGDSHVPAWSRDGKWIYYELGDGSGRETWKIPVEGGGAVRVADYGMFDLAESFDGRDLYYTNRTGKGGIWRRPVTGGEPIMLKGTEKVQLFRYWSLSKGGIFFVDGRANPVIQFFDFATGQVHPFARIRRGIIRGPRGLAASPDGSEVLYMEEDLTIGDILLVENLPGWPR